MEQKSMIQLVALGMFSFALGIITTLTIQTVVEPQSSGLTSTVSSSGTVTSHIESSVAPQGPWQGFSDTWDVQGSEETSNWEGLTPQVVATLESSYPGYDIDEVHVFGANVFVFIELDILLNNETIIDTDIFLVFESDGTLPKKLKQKYPSPEEQQNLANNLTQLKYNPSLVVLLKLR